MGSASVVFRLRDPALITNDNLESNMDNDDIIDSMTYALGKSMAESIVNTQNTMTMATTGMYNLTDHMTGAAIVKSHGRPVEIKPFEVQPDMAMLEDASSPYNIDPETLANLWVVRFGKGWVGNEAVEATEDDVDWWCHCANRLRELGYLEMHTLASSYRIVMRIVE